ncbi:hypothetical protein AGABI1DRAFT_70904 [Agaricus bisporus var. burnettii JB137-S8]|uniref:DUF7137 domain-containing protein n=1 Tax=Agaricus bisporus var. burnettii (strain JB137-S8 / ATCC MYA-4627 / FGSC 10392) TaxID=597362 RepID=K5Y2X4_AGABU|nr:uncharacterized protein AGABI1DRAFT_70904 [Agaricus bisporus var. burnettii JB137-S8]EKM82250.1 hypothetical protein AGABI1DRAFT_70904 [Agaricus bisporus var. burnettii JB137-S8]
MSQSSSPGQTIVPIPAPTSTNIPANNTPNTPDTINITNTTANSISLNGTISSNLLTSATSPSSPAFPITAQVGFLTLTQPPQHSTSYYKIGLQNITFGWNFSYILQQPQHLTIKAICDDTHNTYPVGSISGMNEAGVIPGTATEVIWDLKKYQEENQELPLGPGNYRLTIWDERGESAIPGPGLMRQFAGLKFGMYTPRDYVPLDNWTCAQCSQNDSVLTMVAHPALVGFLVSVLVILLSGFQLLRSID